MEKVLLQLLSKNFPKDHEMHKLFNKNTEKISYSCNNYSSLFLSTNNNNILNQNQTLFGYNAEIKVIVYSIVNV